MDSRPNRRNKSAFSNFCGSVWTEPETLSTTTNLISSQQVDGFKKVTKNDNHVTATSYKPATVLTHMT